MHSFASIQMGSSHLLVSFRIFFQFLCFCYSTLQLSTNLTEYQTWLTITLKQQYNKAVQYKAWGLVELMSPVWCPSLSLILILHSAVLWTYRSTCRAHENNNFYYYIYYKLYFKNPMQLTCHSKMKKVFISKSNVKFHSSSPWTLPILLHYCYLKQKLY